MLFVYFKGMCKIHMERFVNELQNEWHGLAGQPAFALVTHIKGYERCLP